MAFEDLNKEQLLAAVEAFGVDVRKNAKEETIIKELKEEGVTWQMYVAEFPEAVSEDDDDDEPVDEPVAKETAKEVQKPVASDERRILIKMERQNPTYEVLGYRFTSEHPYALVTMEHANILIESQEGFRQASPREAEEYYA